METVTEQDGCSPRTLSGVVLLACGRLLQSDCLGLSLAHLGTFMTFWHDQKKKLVNFLLCSASGSEQATQLSSSANWLS